MVVREVPYTCDCCQARQTVRSGENRKLPAHQRCTAPSCPACRGPCNGAARPFSI